MKEEWVAKSLTVWGVVLATLTGLVPAVNGWMAVMGWDFSLTPEWVANLDSAVKAFIGAAGMLAGVVMVMWDRLKNDTNKALVWANPKK